MTAASEAQKVITFGEESCNMLKGVTSVVSQTVDGAERVLGRVVPVPLLNNNINNSIVSPSPSVLSSSSSPSSLNGFQQQQQQSPAHDVQMVYHPVVVSVVGKGKGKGRATAADNEDIDMTDAHHHHHYGDDSNGEGGMDLD